MLWFQLNELNSLVESRLSERNVQVETVTNQLEALRDVIKQKDEEIASLRSTHEAHVTEAESESQ